MKFTRALRAGLAALALGATASAADIAGNVKYFQSEAQQPRSPGTFESYPEVNTWYTLPGNIKGYSFLDVYANTKNSYHGKTTLTEKIVGPVNAAATWRYTGRAFSDLGLGAKLAIPVRDGYATVGLQPVWLDGRQHREDKRIYGFSFGKNLGHGLNVESFGEWKDSTKGTKWSYGEAELTKVLAEGKAGKLKLGVNVALQPCGKSRPKPEPRAMIRWDWKLNTGGKNNGK